MFIKKPIIAGLMSLATFAPCKAQKAVQFVSESGVTGEINKELSYFGGLHANILKSKNNTDIYCGMVVDAEKQFTFESQLENEYSWTENLSSWIRETFHLSKRESNLTSEVAPVKINTSVKKLDISVMPAYTIQHDFREKDAKQGLNAILNTVYNIDSKNSLEFEAVYSSEPAKNLFKTSFGKLKDNFSASLSYLRKF